MTDETRQKWAEINAVLNPPPSTEVVPLPAQANRAAMTPESQETAFEHWVEFINAKPTQTWKPDEVAAIRFAARRALRTL
jgi:hypothetical protein